jgi:hypothetical protein
VSITAAALGDFWRHPLQDGEVRTLLLAVGLAYLMALFPDTDTVSRPRRYFDRLIFAGMLLCLWWRALGAAALLGMLAIAPLLQPHRGWTHSWWTPWVFAVLLAIAWAGMEGIAAGSGGFGLPRVIELMRDRWILTAAIVCGHYTHLLLDLPLFSRLRGRYS